MPEPITAITMIVKKIAVDILTDPEKIIKYLFWGIIFPLLFFMLILALPSILIVSIPSILLSGDVSAELTAQQIQTIAIYQEAPVTINKDNLKWIENKKEEYSWCDDILVEYNFNLTWQHLMSIDSVLLEQDFTKSNQNKILNLGERFLIKNTSVETYEVDVDVGHSGICEDDCNNEHIESVTKHRAIISIQTKSFNNILNEIGFDSFEKDLALNIYNIILNADVEGNFNIFDEIDITDLKEYPSGNANLPYYNQGDKRWGAFSYGSSSIKTSGCGPTSLAMVVSGLKGRPDINPKIVADWSYANGHRAEGSGSYWSLMTAGGQYYGLDVESVSRKNPTKIVKALSEGYPIIVSMGRGHFTNGGHFIVLRGITNDGKILVHDSASVARSNQAWDLGIIMNESSTNGGQNGSPFWIFKP